MAASPAAMSAWSSPSAPAPSTPMSAGGSRHLKRLSLGGSAFSPSSLGSPGSPSSPATPRSASGSTRGVTGPGGGHGSRSLKLNVSCSTAGGIGNTHGSAGAADESPSTSRSVALPRDSPSSISALASPSVAGSSGTPPSSASSRLYRSASNGHARRMSSISYASSSREAGPDSPHGLGLGLGALGSPPSASPGSRARHALGLGVGSPALSRPITPVGEEEHERSRSITPNASRREEENEDATSNPRLAGGRASSPLFSRQLAAQGSAGGQPTLTEANADLLSFIAKKERKCLDLREELKRHEEELQALKKKWEAIVAKSLVSATPPTTTSMPRLSSPDMKRSSAFTHQPTVSSSSHASASSFSSASSASPSTSPTPRHAPLHSLDISLLSSTFDTSPSLNSLDSIQTDQLEMPESVQAASKWVGGMFGKVLDAVNTLEDAIAPIVDRDPERDRDRELDTLREEDEPDEGSPPGAGVTRNDSISSVTTDARRSSKASMTSSASFDSSSSFGFGFLGGSRKSVEERRPAMEEEEVKTPTFAPASHEYKGKTKDTLEPIPSPDLAQRRGALTGPPPVIRQANPGHGHGRSRSTFDVLSGVAGGGWGALGAKWTAVKESETFKNSKKTTIGLLDTFEQGLATALGPLDPPPLSPISDHGRHLASPPPSTAQSTRPTPPTRTRSTSSDPTSSSAEVGLTSPEPDWSAFLDGDESAAISNNPTSPPVRGYKRPSLTQKPPKTPISAATLGSNSTTTLKAKRLSAQSNGSVIAEKHREDDGENWPAW